MGIRHIASGEIIATEIKPYWSSYMWECGNIRITDVLGNQYEWDGVESPPTQEMREVAKVQRALNVEAIKVTTTAGNTFDGDEISQGRMARAILGLQAAGVATVTWVLSNNTPIQVTTSELGEALALAGAAQAAIWVI